MRRWFGLMTAMVLVGALALPAFADIDKNPNHEALGPGECTNGASFEEVVSPTEQSPFAKEVTAQGLRGVAKAIYLTDSDGNALVTIFERPGKGLDQVTVRCWWVDEGSPTGYVGGDILFPGKDRG